MSPVFFHARRSQVKSTIKDINFPQLLEANEYFAVHLVHHGLFLVLRFLQIRLPLLPATAQLTESLDITRFRVISPFLLAEIPLFLEKVPPPFVPLLYLWQPP